MTESNKPDPLELEAIEQKPEKIFCPICGHVQYELTECEHCGQNLKPKKSRKGLYLVITGLVVIVLAFNFIRDQDGRFIITLDDDNSPQLNPPDWNTSSGKIKKLFQESKTKIDGQVTIHKWQDKDGVWHYSNQSPEHEAEADKKQVLNIDLETNVIPHENQ